MAEEGVGEDPQLFAAGEPHGVGAVRAGPVVGAAVVVALVGEQGAQPGIGGGGAEGGKVAGGGGRAGRLGTRPGETRTRRKESRRRRIAAPYRLGDLLIVLVIRSLAVQKFGQKTYFALWRDFPVYPGVFW
ncbi:hypothetical protein GCM10020219_067800 [Nonomuraea dietziae]